MAERPQLTRQVAVVSLAAAIVGTGLLLIALAGHASASERGLNARTSDPTEPMIQFVLQDTFAPSVEGGDGVANQFQLQPVIPIPERSWFPFEQIIRPTIPIVTTPGPDRTTGLGDIAIFDLVVLKRFSTGSFAMGPVFVFPSATDDRLGQGKWQVGPAFSVLYQGISRLQLGFIVQNPISFAGDSDRQGVNTLLFQPIGQYNFDEGWYVSIGDFNWSFDWKDGGAATIPVAFQVGRIVKIGNYNFNLALEGAYVAKRQAPAPRGLIRFGFALLLPE